MAGKFFDPQTGETYTFGDGEQPPAGWRELGPQPPWPGALTGGCTYYPPGREPRLFVDPETGKTQWVNFPYFSPILIPLKPRTSPPPGTGDERAGFDPETGQHHTFGPGETPPPGWKPLGPRPPPPGGDLDDAAVEQGKCERPRLFIDPQSGEMRWFGPGECPPDGWRPLRAEAERPAGTQVPGRFYDPATGRWHEFGAGQRPPAGWKKLGPIPSPTPGLPPGSTVTWVPGREPQLYVDTATGEVHWVRPPQPPKIGWKPLTEMFQPPGGARDVRTAFDPKTGEAYAFGPGQKPPETWKKLGAVPDRDPPGLLVSYLPGREPRAYVDPVSGEVRWVAFGEAPPEGWLPLTWRFAPPPGTNEEGAYFTPETGHSYVFEPGETPPDGWLKLGPVPAPAPDLPAGGEPVWVPGQEPVPFVDPATGKSGWFFVGRGAQPPPGWLPLTSLLTAPADVAPVSALTYSREPEPPIYSIRSREDGDGGGSWSRIAAQTAAGLNPVLEWAIWNPGWGVSKSRLGYITYMRGTIFEWFAGNNLGRTYPAADYLNPTTVGQIKSTLSTDPKYLKHGVMRRAARKLLAHMRKFPTIFGGRAAQLDVIVPTGTTAKVVNTIETALEGAKKPLPVKVTVTQGVPGPVGTALKGLSVVGGVVSTYQLYHDVQKGDIASGIGSGAGVVTSTLELGALGLGSTTMAAGGALTGSFALGYAAGTLINDHVLEQETKSLIGETLVEFIDNGWTDFKEFYFGIKPK